jgi:hypothetical protein
VTHYRFLLRGEALKNADEWARGKRLSDADEFFLRESREVEKVESNLKLEAERQARETAEQERLIALRQQEIAEEEARVLYQITKERQQIGHPVWNLYRQEKQLQI